MKVPCTLFSSKSVLSQKKTERMAGLFFKWMYSGGLKLYKTLWASYHSTSFTSQWALGSVEEKNPTAVFTESNLVGLLLSPNRLQTEEEEGNWHFYPLFLFYSPTGAIFSLLLLSPEEEGGERKREKNAISSYSSSSRVPKRSGGKIWYGEGKEGKGKKGLLILSSVVENPWQKQAFLSKFTWEIYKRILKLHILSEQKGVILEGFGSHNKGLQRLSPCLNCINSSRGITICTHERAKIQRFPMRRNPWLWKVPTVYCIFW